MITGTTKSGFEFQVDEMLLDDMNFVELLAECEESVLALPRTIKYMLGEEGKKKLYDHCSVDGRVSREKIDAETGEIIEFLGKAPETKN